MEVNPDLKSDDTLLNQAFDITMMGVFLTLIIAMVESQITGKDVIIICCYLAVTFIWRLVWPIHAFRRYLWWQLFSLMMVGVFSWWLIYTAENTRAGWYRFNVLQTRVQSFVRHAPAYVIMADSDGKINETSDNIELLTGYTPKELIGQHVTMLMREGPAAKHLAAYKKAIRALRNPYSPDQGWTLQGLLTVAIKHKNGSLVPVKAYAGGIRWSTEIQFSGDIDMFAVFVPVSENEALRGRTTIKGNDKPDIQVAPSPPPAPTPASLKG